jgi:predicted acyltransferase
MDISAAGDIPGVRPSTHRAVALDILRGLAILMMVFSSCIPFEKPLPNWLFHAQEPTTFDQNHLVQHIFDPGHAGLTFVDLVFPTFLFCLGAAIPLALSGKLDRGASKPTLLLGGLQRLLQLCWFAVYIGNIRPAALHDHPAGLTWVFALIGYILMYPMFVRLPSSWNRLTVILIRIIGYGGGAALLAYLDHIRYYPHGAGFALWRVDVIIVALADMAFFGTAIWVFTRFSALNRLGILGVLLSIRLGALEEGWLHNIWTYAPTNTGCFFAFDYMKYLFLVVPGTIAGDMIHQWISNKEPAEDSSVSPQLPIFVVLVCALVPTVLIGYESRNLWQTAAICFGAIAAAHLLLRKPKDPTQSLESGMAKWGSYWLAIGVLLEPFEGGIKKDPSTLSYYFVTAGLAYFMLAALITLTESMKLQKPFVLAAYSGQNPMIAYVSMANLIFPVFALLDVRPILDRTFGSPWMGVALAGIETLILAILVSILSNIKVFWRT